MKTAHFALVSAIRRKARTGSTVLELATFYHLETSAIEQILATRTREAATAALEDNSLPCVNRFLVVHGMVIDFTKLLQR